MTLQVIDDKLLTDAILDDKLPAEAEALRYVLNTNKSILHSHDLDALFIYIKL